MDFNIDIVFKQLEGVKSDIEKVIADANKSKNAIDVKGLEDTINDSLEANVFTKLEEGMAYGEDDVRARIYEAVNNMKSFIKDNIDTLALNEAGRKALMKTVEKSEISKRVEESKKLDEKVAKIAVGTNESRIEKNTRDLDKYEKSIKLTESLNAVSKKITLKAGVADTPENRKQATIELYKDLSDQLAIHDKEVEKIKNTYGSVEASLKSHLKYENDRFSDSLKNNEAMSLFFDDEKVKSIIEEARKGNIDEEFRKIISDPKNVESLIKASKVTDKDLKEFKDKVKQYKKDIEVDQKVISDDWYNKDKVAVKEMKKDELSLAEYGFTTVFRVNGEEEGKYKDLTTLTDEEKVKFMDSIVNELYSKENKEKFAEPLKTLEQSARAEAEKSGLVLRKSGILSKFFRGLVGRPTVEQEQTKELVRAEIARRVKDFAKDYENNQRDIERNEAIDKAKERGLDVTRALEEDNKKEIEELRKKVALEGKTADKAVGSSKKIRDYSEEER